MPYNFKLRLYIETTVFNYFYDTERKGHEDVVKLFEKIKEGKFKGYTSRYVTDELERASEPKRSKMISLIRDYDITILDHSTNAEELAEKYIAANVVPESKFYDSVHIAISSVHEIDVIVSYNFHHINRKKTKILTAAINNNEGYNQVIISTAEEVLYYGSTFRDESD